RRPRHHPARGHRARLDGGSRVHRAGGRGCGLDGLHRPDAHRPRRVVKPAMAAAFITCSPPRAMATEAATAWLERRAELLRDGQAVEEVTLRELRPSHQDIV